MSKKNKKFESLIGRWAVPITKDFDSKKDLKSLLPLTCETRFAKLKNGKWILVRKLTKEDIKSLDFKKYLSSFKIKSIEKIIK